MPIGKEELAYNRKKIRTYSKRLVIGLSFLLGLTYLATSWFDTPDFSLHFVISGTILNLALFALSSWSLNDHLHKQNMNKKVGIENTNERKKLIRISLDITSSISSSLGGIISLVGSIASLSLRDHSIIFAISTLFFALGYTIMAVNIVWSCSSYLDNKFCKQDLESEPQQNIDNPDKDDNPDKGHFCNLITELREPSESRAI